MKDNRKYRNPLWLIREYVHNERYVYDIADECGVGTPTISRWISKFHIGKKENNPINEKYKDRDWLYDQYITQNKTIKEIAKGLGVYFNTIREALQKYKIKKQNRDW